MIGHRVPVSAVTPLPAATPCDIAQQRDIERELHARKAMLEAALSSMSDAVVICDPQGRVIECNDAFATFYKFKAKAECPRTVAEYPEVLEVFTGRGDPVPPEQWAVLRALRGESASGVEYQLRRRDTGQSWIGSYSFAPTRSEDGAIMGAVVTARDVTELKQRQAEVQSAHADLLRLVAAKDRVQEEERQRIARDLHDDLQQTLTAIKLDVGAVAGTLRADPEAASSMLAKVGELAAGAIRSTRRIVNDLQPQVLEDLGLVPALEALADQFNRRTGVSCRLDVLDASGAALPESSLIATSLYRIAQEALNNVVKHARAGAVHMQLATTPEGDLQLRVTDNGKGMSVADRKKAQSFGLLGMQERVRALGGSLRIDSRVGAGTAIEVVVPLPAPRPPAHAAGAAAALAAPGPPDARSSLQASIDALPGNIAVLDPRGVIRLTNRAWREFAECNGDPGVIATGPGVNYLGVCRRAAQEDGYAEQALKGLLAVLDGSRDEAVSVYPCHSPHEQRWFLARVAPTIDGNVQVTHSELSHRAEVVRPGLRAGKAP